MSRLCIYFKGGLIRIMWRVSGERRGKQLGDLLRSSGGPDAPPPGGLNTLGQCLRLRLCPSVAGCPSGLRVPGGSESEDCRGAGTAWVHRQPRFSSRPPVELKIQGIKSEGEPDPLRKEQTCYFYNSNSFSLPSEDSQTGSSQHGLG